MNKLKQLISKGHDYYPTDKGSTHSYIDIYDQLMLPYKHQTINILEVGVEFGGSIKLWSDYFTDAHIFGYDIVNKLKEGIFDDCKNVSFVVKSIQNIHSDEFNDTPLTIAIDDASHTVQDQLLFIQVIYPQIVKGGMLIIEDVQDIDNQVKAFKSLGLPFEIIDLRNVKGRYDDVLLIFRKD
jgi:cephalosporin hydroxylase